MTITTKTFTVTYTADGIVTNFNVTYPFAFASDLQVFLNGVLQSSGYSVVLYLGNWTVNFVTPPVAGVSVLIKRNTAKTQTYSFTANGNFPAASNESALDKLTMVLQEVSTAISSGTGDMLSYNNLSELTSPTAARNNLGLGNINNTSDANKPLSTADIAALALKASISSLAAIATSGSAADLVAGTIPTLRMPALTGDVTTVVNAVATTIGAGVVTYAKMQNVSTTSKIMGRATAGAGSMEELTNTQVKTILAIASTDVSGLGTLSTQSGTFSGTHSGSSSGTNTGDQTITLTGHVTGSGTGSFATTIAASVVTLAMQANLAANSLMGNNTGVGATPLALTAVQVKTLLAIANTDVSGLGTLATASTVSLTTQATGVLQAAQEPAHTGDVTNTAGSLALTIAAGVVTYAKMQNVSATSKIMGRATAGAGSMEELTNTQVKTILAIANTDVSGLGTLSTQSGTFSGTHSGTSSGSNTGDQTITLTGNVTGTGTGSFATTIAAGVVTLAMQANLAANSIMGNNTGAGTTPLALTGTQVKTLLAITTADFTGTTTAAQEPAHTGDVTNTAGSLATTIAAGAVTLAKMANLAANSIMGNNTGAGAAPLALTGTQATAMLDNFTSTLKGLTPLSGGGSVNFLRADGTWAVPPGSGSVVQISVRQTVSYGPDTSGAPSFLPATSASLSITSQNITSSAPLVVTAAQGANSSGAINTTVTLVANVTWTSVTASNTNYLYINTSSGATGFTTLAPIYQYGGTSAVTNGQFTFNYGTMTGFMGNGTTAPATPIVFVGELVAGASTITSTIMYAYNGFYDSGFTATLPGVSTAVSKPSNLGLIDLVSTTLIYQCTTADNGYAIGDQIQLSASSSNVISFTRNTTQLSTSNLTIAYAPKAGGTNVTFTAASWKYKITVKRLW